MRGFASKVNLPKGTARKRELAGPQTHDYTNRFWGHDYAITAIRKKGHDISITGWGSGISVGDYILLESQSNDPDANQATRYKVEKIEYRYDPSDMWSMDAVFAPRELLHKE